MIKADPVGEGGGKFDVAAVAPVCEVLLGRSDKHHEWVTTSGAEARRLEMLGGNDKSGPGKLVFEGLRCASGFLVESLLGARDAKGDVADAAETSGASGASVCRVRRALPGLLGFWVCFAVSGCSCSSRCERVSNTYTAGVAIAALIFSRRSDCRNLRFCRSKLSFQSLPKTP